MSSRFPFDTRPGALRRAFEIRGRPALNALVRAVHVFLQGERHVR